MTVEINLGKHTVTQSSLLDAIRNSASNSYQSSVPLANANDINRTVEAITGNAQNFSEFFNIITRIGRANIDAAYWRDPLDREFNKGQLTEGDSVQNIIVGMAAEHAFSFNDADKVFQVEKPDVSALYSTVNRHSKYKVSVSMPEARRILLGPNGVENLYNRIMESLRSGAERDNTKATKDVINRSIDNGVPFFVEVKNNADGSIDYKDLVKQMRYYHTMMCYVDNPDKYNAVGMENPTRAENVNVLLPALTQANVDVDVLASAFNMDRATFIGKQIPVNALANSDVLGMMVDNNFIQIYDQLDQTASIFNPEVLTEQNFLHVWKSYSYVKFFNAICFVKQGSPLLKYNFTKFYFDQVGDLTVNAKKTADYAIRIPRYLKEHVDQLNEATEGVPFTLNVSVKNPDNDQLVNATVDWENSGATAQTKDKEIMDRGYINLHVVPTDSNLDGLAISTVSLEFSLTLKTDNENPLKFGLSQQNYLNSTTM